MTIPKKKIALESLNQTKFRLDNINTRLFKHVSFINDLLLVGKSTQDGLKFEFTKDVSSFHNN
jgi:hypothetical protein